MKLFMKGNIKMNEENEKIVEMVEFPIDMSEEEAEALCEKGLEWIKEDKEALINYAVNHILQEVVDKESKINEMLRREISKNDKG